MKPFPCNFCHQPTLRICRDSRLKNDLVNCCKSCQAEQNKSKEHITISSVCKQDKD